jgi:hypothetical protein
MSRVRDLGIKVFPAAMMELVPTDCTENTQKPCKPQPKPTPRPKSKASHPGITERQVAQLKVQLRKHLTASP